MGKGRKTAVRGSWCLPDRPTKLLRRRDIVDVVNAGEVVGFRHDPGPPAMLFLGGRREYPLVQHDCQ